MYHTFIYLGVFSFKNILTKLAKPSILGVSMKEKTPRTDRNKFLPISIDDMKKRGWDECDFICVTGDAYVDHPSFGVAVISRLLEAEGFRVGIIARPNWKNADDFKKMGRPRLAFFIASGCVDSMVANYTVSHKPRRQDAYAPGGVGGGRPDRATIAYAARAKEAFKGVKVFLGGLEASLRRFSHYDFWSDTVRRSVLLDAKADGIMYGMSETQAVELAKRLDREEDFSDIRGLVVASSKIPENWDGIILPDFEESKAEKEIYAKSFKTQYDNTDPFRSKPLAEGYTMGSAKRYVIQNPPAFPLTTEEFDRVYELPYVRNYHPIYEEEGGVPSIQEVRFSVISNRGCYGSCSFCALTFHQGRILSVRSHESLEREVKELSTFPDFKGYIHDVGGPTANFRAPSCKKQMKAGACLDKECLWPEPCKLLEVNHEDYTKLLRRLRKIEGIKKVFVRSGIRYDYLMYDNDKTFFNELCEHHISGQLKVAPEHIDDTVLAAMGKPQYKVYEKFEKEYRAINERLQKKQHLVPYFISSHPGSDLHSAIKLALHFKKNRFIPEQVQDYYPTPGTVATCMYYTGIDPRNGKEIYVARGQREKSMQRALLQFNDPKNRKLVLEALKAAGREDLIGNGKDCLVRG